MFCIGIDPGISGAVAILKPGEDPAVYDMQDPRILKELEWLQHMPVKALIEKVHSMPQQGVVSTFKFGTQYGRAIGWLEANGIAFEYITPGKWWSQIKDSEYGTPKTAKAKKEAALSLARRLFPKLATEKLARKKDHNRAEALLLAEVLKRKGENDLK